MDSITTELVLKRLDGIMRTSKRNYYLHQIYFPRVLLSDRVEIQLVSPVFRHNVTELIASQQETTPINLLYFCQKTVAEAMIMIIFGRVSQMKVDALSWQIGLFTFWLI